MKYTITIQNNTGDANQAFSYIAFGFPHVTNATRGPISLPVVFYQSPLLNDGEPISFDISSEVFGFLGTASQTNAALTWGAKVSLRKPLAVTLGSRTANGTDIDVGPSTVGAGIDFKKAETKESPPGTFSIITKSAVKDNNQYVVGLARKVDDQYAPVSVFGLHPGQTFEITPVESIYIARDTTATNILINPTTITLKQEINLLPDQPKVTVTNDNSTTGFTVRYH
jgi:hypothetical protein